MKQLLIEVGVAAALILTGAGLMWKHDAAKIAAKQAQVDSLTAAAQALDRQRAKDGATLARLAQKNAAAARETALLRRSLDRALAANPAWTAQPLPKEVSDALQ